MQVLIIDLGSQYTLVIARTLRELGFRSAVLSPDKAELWLKHNTPKAIILSGGYNSVYDKSAPHIPDSLLSNGIPLLGICYGMQWIVRQLKGRIQNSGEQREYGKARVRFSLDSKLFEGLQESSIVWASHGDSIKYLPECLYPIATAYNSHTLVTAVQHTTEPIYGVQFHPEVTHTPEGKKILSNFVEDIAECQKDWNSQNMIEEIQENLRETCGNEKVLIGFSGGVDSTTLSAILHPVFGDRLRAICIDTGALREGELLEIQANANSIGIDLKIIDAKDRFFKVLQRILDPEKKRKAFKLLYTAIFNEEIAAFGATRIIQGSLASDYIESGVGEGDTIKSHHNYGNEFIVPQQHPIEHLFKYEVRELAKTLGLMDAISQRPPFPGPGLFIRVVDTAITKEKIVTLRWADNEVTKILKKHGVYDEISQVVVGVLGFKTVGVKGDKRDFSYPIGVRGVETVDFMTANGYQIAANIRREITETLTKHAKINRVFFDEGSKPPATVEWQ